MLLYLKHSPSKLDDLFGNDEARMQARRWILNWLRGKKQRPILIHGPVGTGKTSVAVALQKEYDLELIQMGTSELRNKENIERVFSNAATADSLSGKKKLLLIDDVDALQRSDSGGSAAISRLLRSSACPIMLTALDIWDKKLSGIRAECEIVAFRKITKPSISKVLARIVAAEGMVVPEETILSIAEGANGDVRSAINDLQSGASGSRDREKDIFERVRAVFKSVSYADAKKATQGDVDYNLLKLWVDENIPAEYEVVDDLARAYNMLSRADIFEGRIRNSHWGYLKYTIDLMSIGVALSKSQLYRKFTKYQFPKYLKEMGATVARRAMMKEIGKKIGAHVHLNRRDALGYMYIVRHFAESEQDLVMGVYGFTEDEIAFILETTVEEVKKKSKNKKTAMKEEGNEKESKEAEKEESDEKEEQKSGTKTENAIPPKPKTRNAKPIGDTKLNEFF